MSSEHSTPRKILALLTRHERRELVLLFLLMLLAVVAEAVGIGLVIPALALLTDAETLTQSRAVKPAIEALGNPEPEFLIGAGMLMLVLVYLLKNLFLGFVAWRQSRFAHNLDVQMGQRLFALYLAQPYTFHLQRNSAYLINSISNEVSHFALAGVGTGLLLVAEIAVMAGIGALLLAIEPAGTLVIGGMVCLAGVAFHRVTRSHISRWARARQFHDEMSYQHLQQGIGAAKDVILLGRESEFLAQYLWHNTRRAHAGHRREVFQKFPRLALEFLAVTSLAVVTIFLLAQGRSPQALVPILGLFAAAAYRLMPSINRILTSLQMVRFSAPAVDQLYRDMTSLRHSAAKPAGDEWRFQQALELVDIQYTYPSAGRPALESVSFRAEHGESIGIIGPSGAGKSTLIDITLGLLMPDKGKVLVDGREIRENLRSWQNQIGYVPQVIYLSDDTLRRNVAFGLPDDEIDEDAVRAALAAAQLEEFTKALPEELDTKIGERGSHISGGERQRIGIARALYHGPEVLVLDEATSSLDTATERGIMATVRDLKGSKTVIVVSHRATAIEHCDRVYELNQGTQLKEVSKKYAVSAGMAR